MPGRKPKPPVLKIIEGNRGKRPIPEVVEPIKTENPPECPLWLTVEAKEEWDRIVGELHAIGLLSNLDVVPLAVYCQSYARYVEAERFLTEHGTTKIQTGRYGVNKVLRPEYYQSKSERNFIRQFCSEFGLSPSARARMILPGEKEEDEFDAFVSRNQRRTG